MSAQPGLARPPIDAGRLWAGGVATAIVAALIGLVGVLTAAAAVLPFVTGGSTAVALATSAIHLVIGLAIGSLVSGAAISAIRTGARPTYGRELG